MNDHRYLIFCQHLKPGMAVWANDRVVKQLKDWGPDAIEYYYTPEQQAYYLCLTEMYRLHQTG